MRRTLAGWIVGVVAASSALGAAGCGSSARVSGMAFLDNRILTVGEIVDIRIPYDRQAGAEWAVESYDSVYLGFVARSLQMRTEDKGTLLVQFRAKTPGETTLTLRRQYSTGSGRSASEKYSITILSQ
jgi:hypothetical protein